MSVYVSRPLSGSVMYSSCASESATIFSRFLSLMYFSVIFLVMVVSHSPNLFGSRSLFTDINATTKASCTRSSAMSVSCLRILMHTPFIFSAYATYSNPKASVSPFFARFTSFSVSISELFLRYEDL